MSWTEILLLLILINLLTQSQWKIIKIIRIIRTLRIITYIYNNTQTLSNNTWTTFIQIWILIGGLFLLKTINTHDLTTITIRSRIIIASIILTTFKNWIILYITIELITITTLLLIRFNNNKEPVLNTLSDTYRHATYNQNRLQ